MLTKRGKVWWIDAQINGKRIRASTGTSDRKAAQELADNLKAEAWRVQRLGEKPLRSFDEAAERWLGEKAHLRGLASYRKHIAFWAERAAGLELREITRDWADRQVAGMVSRKNKPAAPATRNRYLGTLRAILTTACREWEWIERVPAFRFFKADNKRMTVLTPAQARLMVEAVPEAMRPAIAFAFLTGLRKSNVFGLTWDKVDLDRRVAWVDAEDAKAGKQITVPLSAPAIQLLEGLPRQGSRVFAALAPCTPSWRRYVKRAGVPAGFRFHDIRHTWASWHAMAGTDIKTLQALGGWSSPAMLERYVHFLPDHLAAAQDKMAARLGFDA